MSPQEKHLGAVDSYWLCLNERTKRRYLKNNPQIDFAHGIVFVLINIAHTHWQCAVVAPIHVAYKTTGAAAWTTHVVGTYRSLGWKVDVLPLLDVLQRIENITRVKVKAIPGPKQENNYDCGCYMLRMWMLLCGWDEPVMFKTPGPAVISKETFEMDLTRLFRGESVPRMRMQIFSWIETYCTSAHEGRSSAQAGRNVHEQCMALLEQTGCQYPIPSLGSRASTICESFTVTAQIVDYYGDRTVAKNVTKWLNFFGATVVEDFEYDQHGVSCGYIAALQDTSFRTLVTQVRLLCFPPDSTLRLHSMLGIVRLCQTETFYCSFGRTEEAITSPESRY